MTPNDGRGREENTASSSSVAATATALALDDLDKGILPILPGDSELDGNYPKQQPATNAATGASAASVRLLSHARRLPRLRPRLAGAARPAGSRGGIPRPSFFLRDRATIRLSGLFKHV
ncbi:hypothetical protein VTK73DRAFT_5499 [Phialemonium thermophilum]|uniref:Uncharacterized protein n=1 Tax=Phialemonium thermophilum TaxID=223376 RepID=A0ABR3V1G0_9PEZI